MSSLAQDARAVLLPICEPLSLTPWLASFLAGGGQTFIMATSSSEYAERSISSWRRATEKQEDIRHFTRLASAAAGHPVLVAVDAEPGGVERLEHLLPALPTRESMPHMSDEALSQAFIAYAQSAHALGISLFLGPVVDFITGTNEWLQGRILGSTREEIARVASLFVAAAQSAGIVATAKHFPGHPHLEGHPVHSDVNLTMSVDEVQSNLGPFQAVIDIGVSAVMIGPVTVEAIDVEQPAATSSVVVRKLRQELGFSGLIVSDDLDAVSTMKGRPLGSVAVASLKAGVDLLLIPGGIHVDQVVSHIHTAVNEGELSRDRLAAAASSVRGLAVSSDGAGISAPLG